MSASPEGRRARRIRRRNSNELETSASQKLNDTAVQSDGTNISTEDVITSESTPVRAGPVVTDLDQVRLGCHYFIHHRNKG